MSAAPLGQSRSAPAAGCAADILLALARSNRPLTLSEIAQRTGATKSLVYRSVSELEARQFVGRAPSGGYSLGLTAIEVGGAYSASVPLLSSIRRTLRTLADATGETVSLGVLRGDQVLYLMREEGVRSVFAVSHVGKRLPANAVALGKALLARMPDERVLDELGQAPLRALTPRTLVSLEALLGDLAEIRARGFAEEHGEAVTGRCCLAAAAAFPAQDFDAVAISVSMDEGRFAAERTSVSTALLEARDRIQQEARDRTTIGDPPAPLRLIAGDLF